jgi:hypothetical protein
VVFDLFQDLEGFSLDDYKPFSDVSSSLQRLVRFLSAAVVDRGHRLVKIDDETYEAVERQCDAWLHATAASAAFQPDERIDLFRHTVEPTLQRELRHKGAANGDGSYSAELIGYVEIRGQPEVPER